MNTMTHKVRYDIRVERMKAREYYVAYCPQVPTFSAHSGNLDELRERIASGLERALKRQGMKVASVTVEPEAPAAPDAAFVTPSAAIAHLEAA